MKEDNKDNTGNCNSGHRNSGDYNSGHRNPGNYNSGNYNSGNGNSGDRNSGDYNSGDGNSGYWNSGNRNSGDYNSGYWNSGNRNSGNYNSGHRNSGFFNYDQPKMRLFNKESNLIYDEVINILPNFSNFTLTEWVPEAQMTADQKREDEHFHVKGGTLITYTYEEAWSNYWATLSEDDRNKFLALPNFCPKIFKEITGLDVNASCSGKIVEIDGKKYELKEVKE